MDKLLYETGFGILPKSVMHDTNLSMQAKCVFAYFVTYAGTGNTAFPKRDTIMYHLGISKDSLTKYLKELKTKGYLEVEQVKSEKGRFQHNVYKLIPYPNFSDTEKPDTKISTPKNNSSLKETDNKKIYSSSKVDELWKLYPKKKKKTSAYKKIPKLLEEYGFEQIERCIKRYVDDIEKMHIEKKYILLGSTFFNGRFEDYLDDNYTDSKEEKKGEERPKYDKDGFEIEY